MKITFELNSIDELGALREWLNTTSGKVESPMVGVIPIEALSLTVRSENCLKEENIRTIANLVTWSAHDLLKTPRLGCKSLKEIDDALKRAGLALADNDKATRETTPYEATKEPLWPLV